MTFNLPPIHWTRLVLGAVLTGACALSVHAVMLQGLGIPVPDMSLLSKWSRYPIQAVAVLGLIFLWQVASRHRQRSLLRGALILTAVAAMLTETLIRNPFMAGYCTDAWTFAFVGNIQPVLSLAVSALLVVVTAASLTSTLRRVLAALAIAALTMFAATPLIAAAMGPLMQALSNLAPQSEWCTLPYGANVLIPAYLTFAEPVVACFAAAAITWDGLSASRGTRLFQFTLIVVAIKRQLLTPLSYARVAKVSLGWALLSESQFALEAVTLALLTGLVWEWSVGRRAR